MRNSVAIELVNRLVAEGAHVTAYDPKGAEKAVEWKLDRSGESEDRRHTARSGATAPKR